MAYLAPLGGVDVFHLRHHREMVRLGLGGNNCALALGLGGRLDPAFLDARRARAARELPELSFFLEAPLVGRPRWRAGPPPDEGSLSPRLHLLEGDPAGAVAQLLAEPLPRGKPFALDLLRDPGAGEDASDWVVLRWFHPLADAKGAARLLEHLGGEGPAPPPGERFATSDARLETLSRKERLELARAYKAHAVDVGRRPILSPHAAARLGGGRALGEPRAWLTLLDEAETRAFDERVRKRAKLAETHLILLASLRALDAFLVGRRLAPPRYVVPLPLSLDPKAGSTRFFGNNLTMMLFHLEREDLDPGREPEALAKLASQQRAIVKGKLDLAMLASLELSRPLPDAAFRWLSTRPFGGEVSSLVVSNPSAFAPKTFAGLPVVSAFALPAVVPSPGAQVIATRFARRLTATFVYLGGLLDEAEARAFSRALRAELARPL